MKCDLCDQEFANSEEVKRHKEQAHPIGEEGATPDLMQTPAINGLTPNEGDVPEPADR